MFPDRSSCQLSGCTVTAIKLRAVGCAALSRNRFAFRPTLPPVNLMAVRLHSMVQKSVDVHYRKISRSVRADTTSLNGYAGVTILHSPTGSAEFHSARSNDAECNSALPGTNFSLAGNTAQAVCSLFMTLPATKLGVLPDTLHRWSGVTLKTSPFSPRN